MKLDRVISIIDAEILCNVKDKSNVNIKMACGADLMSDVLAFIKSEALLLTGLTTPQVIYSAENSGVDVVCFVRGKRPNKETVDLAKEKQIVLIATKHPMFETCGKLYKNGVIGCSEIKKQ
jgi:predicted transcriptional regulator